MRSVRWLVRQFFNRQFGLFLLVGGTAAAVNWLARLWLQSYASFAAAVALAYGVGVIVAFILNCIFVFPNSRQTLLHRISFFVATNLTMFPLVWIVSVITERYVMPLLGIVAYAEGLSHGIGLAAPVLASFLIHKFFTFGRNDASPSAVRGKE